ncbi:YdbL family protein [Coraliomargarita sp. SDUM461003]|uniref:YdbL family protein n=1 Tax=Thalassobacterium maritimum TaxID=3041265 RepID=A0ABU1APY8_9BACT|nr:YdbL family protein [Coraliomargarita sp. SDUM461003]MDQ8206103.1 YdbL family protein [Coraliomargarita sp. SDUM461003]
MNIYKKIVNCLLLGLISLFCAQVPLSANTVTSSEKALRATMGERLPALMELKLSGLVGETNLGLVEARGSISLEQRRLLSDENQDRLAYYKLISTRLGVSISTVQRKRAEQIRKKSPRGVWIESQSGEWQRN